MKEKSKTSLFLMELVLMILFFAVSAAVCMRVFSSAQLKSNHSDDLSNASLKAQSAAECWKLSQGEAELVAEVLGGEKTESGAAVYFDKEWNSCGEAGAKYILELEKDGDDAKIGVFQLKNGEAQRDSTIFSLTVKAVPNGQ